MEENSERRRPQRSCRDEVMKLLMVMGLSEREEMLVAGGEVVYGFE